MTPQELKNSILQLAIQGKLVEQNKEENMPDLSNVKKIITDEMDFDIPNSWRIAHLESVTISIPAKQYQILDSAVQKEGIYPVISQSKEYSIGYSDDASKVFHHKEPVVVFGDHTTVIKYVNFDFIVGADGVKIFEPLYHLLFPQYLFYVLEYYTVGLEKVGGYSRHYKYIKNKPIPIPPLDEQKRIVAKIEELLPLIDRYEKAWSRLEEFNKRFPDDMQKSILQMAIQGKLVEQRSEEGTGEKLYQQIQQKKQKLIKEGKIRKDKPLIDITDEESNIDIPESWMLCKLATVAGQITDGEHQTPHRIDTNQGYYLLSARNIKDGFIMLDDVDYVDKEEYDRISIRCNPKRGDILISCSGSVGRCTVVEDDNNYVMVRSAAMVSPIMVDSRFLMIVIQSNYVQSQIQKKKKQTAQANLFQDAIRNLVIPLPPLDEQKRIVARLEALLPLCRKLI